MYNKPFLFSTGICYQLSYKLTGSSSDAGRFLCLSGVGSRFARKGMALDVRFMCFVARE